jgi:hypothetical protein
MSSATSRALGQFRLHELEIINPSGYELRQKYGVGRVVKAQVQRT